MMHYFAPVLLIIALLQYTTPSGNAIYVNPEQIIAITTPNDCKDTSNARIITTRGDTCVRETQDQVVQSVVKWGSRQ